jgi:two-component system KDP operon response regulator KdpE
MLVKEKPVSGPVQSLSSSQPVAVLIVDRHGGVSELIRYNIETDSTRVFEAATGIDGIRVLAENPIDLMLLDPSLPDVDIRAFLHHSRTVRPGHRPRVIFMSDDPPDRYLVRQFDVDGYVPKPFDIRDLMDRIDRVTRPGLMAMVPEGMAGN